jgi:hypothetical protein
MTGRVGRSRRSIHLIELNARVLPGRSTEATKTKQDNENRIGDIPHSKPLPHRRIAVSADTRIGEERRIGCALQRSEPAWSNSQSRYHPANLH